MHYIIADHACGFSSFKVRCRFCKSLNPFNRSEDIPAETDQNHKIQFSCNLNN